MLIAAAHAVTVSLPPSLAAYVLALVFGMMAAAMRIRESPTALPVYVLAVACVILGQALGVVH